MLCVTGYFEFLNLTVVETQTMAVSFSTAKDAKVSQRAQ
jgi:hypothetical protein